MAQPLYDGCNCKFQWVPFKIKEKITIIINYSTEKIKDILRLFTLLLKHSYFKSKYDLYLLFEILIF